MKPDDSPRVPRQLRPEWFHERYNLAAVQIIEFFSGDFISLAGKRVADIGCGDGIIDLGLAARTSPASLIGFDLRPVDPNLLSELAQENGVPSQLPRSLQFRTCSPQRLPAAGESFDLAISWSAFHHMRHPLSMVHEIRRVLRPGGMLMIQIYPFFHSQHGSLLEPWFPDGFAQLLHTPEQISAIVRANPGPDPDWAEAMLDTSFNLNRLKVDELGRLLRLGRFRVRRIHLIGEDTHLPVEAADLPLSDVGIGGVKLLAEAV